MDSICPECSATGCSSRTSGLNRLDTKIACCWRIGPIPEHEYMGARITATEFDAGGIADG